MARLFDQARIEQAVRQILEAIGEDPDREGLRGTPRRVAEMYQEIFAGLHQSAEEEISVFFNSGHSEMVMVKDIPLYSMCEHHLLPFVGRAHVAYIPRGGKLTGLSKLARVVDLVARRPQVQERLTSKVADILMQRLDPMGVMVMVEAEHTCMTMRGIRKPGSVTVTSAVRGVFETDERTRQEALFLITERRGWP